MADQHWYNIKYVEALDTPALVVYPSRVKQNIDMVKYAIDDVYRLRPHVKTHKSADVTQLMLDAGITKFKCATIAEAEMLAISKAPDVLFAYQPFGPKLERLMQLIITYPQTKFSCLVDNNLSADAISMAGTKNKKALNVFIDLNVGMNRTGIKPGNDAISLYKYCDSLPGIEPVGLHAYDGHIHDADLETRLKKSNAADELLSNMYNKLVQSGYKDLNVVAGGTPTFEINASRKDIECSPGTFVYWDRGYQLAYAGEQFLPAALVVTRVISMPTQSTLCLDCGHKSLASESELSKRIYFLNVPDLIMVSHSEEHLIVDAGEDHGYKIGDVFYGLPYHICPTVALYERAITIENNIISGEWQTTARDRKINL